ncbi:BTB/POZ domain-containing protein At3g05675 isoform X1 [Abrus precatorius]|uniref:BTB/POZ domain-containing protein At3g05675 isoform X1 n=1 Tax=Abrus precatorius TaxID=3816 RepID=A0A8B8L7I6_ABRPR|nr:BTB/POZ domain-containing protein At3g05675 isoform X1 [Abrus precatorius]XP_027350685.1 BTB/POZ domain-containing protein At3g05675 isoform X1 [Abrus precatorius]
MDTTDKVEKVACVIGDRSTSDVVVRLRTQEGRDDWLYCHSEVLIRNCKYFADRLSEDWPTCQILDSRNCVDVYCQELDFDYHVNLIRLLYIVIDGSVDDLWHGVRNALGVLQVAVELGCPQIVTACVNYLEAVTWEEAEEEEILKIVPRMGLPAEPILARLQPVNQSAIINIFVSAIRFATSSPAAQMNDLKSSAQEQLEYMLTEDDDAPLLTADDDIKHEVKDCVNRLFSRFNNSLIALFCSSTESLSEAGNIQLFQSYLTDLSWVCQILSKLEIMREFVEYWFDASEKIVKVLEQGISTTEVIEIKLRAIEVTSKVLEAIGYGNVILPTTKRLQVLKVWLPFVRVTKPLIDSVTMNCENAMVLKLDGELWQSLESTFVSIILALPSGDQAEVLTEWLENEYMRYPDLTEAFEVWCYRSKVAKRRLSVLGDEHAVTNPI